MDSRNDPCLSYQLLASHNWNYQLTQATTESGSCITRDCQSTSLSWNKSPIWVLRPEFYYCQTIACLLIWGALSDERTSLSFTVSAVPRQRSHSQVSVPWDSRPYFTVSDLRLSFSSPYTTRTAQKTSLPLLRILFAWKTTCPQSCFLATAVKFSLVYTVVTWQWVNMSQSFIRHCTLIVSYQCVIMNFPPYWDFR
jgi:hypothetical protein